MDNFFDVHPEFYDHETVGRHPGLLQDRFDMIVRPIEAELQRASVLDLGAHDGRWGFASLFAGANYVLAVEPDERPLSLAREWWLGKSYPMTSWTSLHSTAEQYLERADSYPYDVVLCLGLLYHVQDITRFFRQVAAVPARLVVVDTEVLPDEKRAVVEYYRGRTNELGHGQYPGSTSHIKGTPSVPMMHLMAEQSGLQCSQVPPRGKYGYDTGARAVFQLRRGER